MDRTMLRAPGGVRVPPTTIAPRMHTDRHLLLWQAHGTSAFRVDAADFALARDEALWIPAGAWHEFTVHEDSVVMPMFFETDAIATTLAAPTVVALGEEARVLCMVILQSQNSIIQPPVNVRRRLLGLIERTPVRPSGLRMPVSGAARSVAEALLLNPGDDRLVEEWAASVHASARSLERAFAAETGMPLNRWRRICRMEAAARLLHELTSIAAVARRVGYENTSAFGRVFRAHHGVSPGRFAAEARSVRRRPPVR